ncbi:uncharacterized protein LOC142532333 [Primulina tabacum]|uniref:uncharacterized protein LOC142532333 n=1 Tax=Primulina tabacum TaxID=48773 RepID=UPI003F59A286
MEENETIVEYDRRLRNIANEAFSLGDPMSNERLVSKVLRSLPERFNIKICAIDESKDTSTLNLEYLISSLRTFEMNLDLQKRNTRKAVALQTTYDSVNSLIQEAKDSDLGEESISLITNKFDDSLKRMRDKKKIVSISRPQFVPFERNKITATTQGNFRSRNDSSGRTETNKLDSVQCRVNPFGVATGAATPGRNTVSKSLCLNAKSLENTDIDKIQETDHEELTVEIIQMMYEELYDDWLKRNETNTILPKENTELRSSLSLLEVLLSRKDLELCKVKDDLEKASKTLAKFNSSTSKLDTTLTMGKDGRTSLGYVESIFEHGDTSNASSKNPIFVKGVENYIVPVMLDPLMKTIPISKLATEQKLKTSSPTFSPSKVLPSSNKPHNKKKVSTSQPKQRKRRFLCHYCYKSGHIKPFCYKLRNDYLNWHSNQVLHKVLLNTKHNTAVKKSSTKKIWVPKSAIQCSVVYTSLKTNIAGGWYFDSGCSRHMTGSKELITDYVKVNSGCVTYGGGAKGRIVGKRTLNVEGLPELHNVLHVEGLNSNLISISQLCDDDLHVKFNKNSCEVFDNANICIMTCARSTDNCYQLGEGDDCRSAKTTDLDLWHKKLGHVSFKTLKNLCRFDAVREKSEEDDTEGLLNTSEPLTSPGVGTGTETSTTTPDTTPPPNRTEVVENENDDDDDVIINIEKDIHSKIQRNHPSSQIIGEVYGDVQTRKKEKVDYRKMIGLVCMSSAFSQVTHSCFISLNEPKNVNDALKDEFWVNAMHEELEQFVRNDVWDLVPRPSNVNVIGSKWILKNKTDESGNIIRNKARLVAQGYTQVDGVDFDETFVPVARMESVRLLLAVACHMHVKLYQMDVKSTFLNGILNEEAYVIQPKGFEDPHHSGPCLQTEKAPV